jgi:hypothetical protein
MPRNSPEQRIGIGYQKMKHERDLYKRKYEEAKEEARIWKKEYMSTMTGRIQTESPNVTNGAQKNDTMSDKNQ